MTITVADFCTSFDGKWCGDDRFGVKAGDVGFLLRLSSYFNGQQPSRRIEMRTHPVKRARTFEPILYGVIEQGATDVEALGVIKVTEATPNGRGKIETIWGDEARDALTKLGYPDLIEQMEDANLPWKG